jgi:hypothetical protein
MTREEFLKYDEQFRLFLTEARHQVDKAKRGRLLGATIEQAEKTLEDLREGGQSLRRAYAAMLDHGETLERRRRLSI